MERCNVIGLIGEACREGEECFLAEEHCKGNRLAIRELGCRATLECMKKYRCPTGDIERVARVEEDKEREFLKIDKLLGDRLG